SRPGSGTGPGAIAYAARPTIGRPARRPTMTTISGRGYRMNPTAAASAIIPATNAAVSCQHGNSGLARYVELCRFLHVHRDGGALRGRKKQGPQVLSLGRRRLVADQRIDQGRQVFVQLPVVERNLADRRMDDAELVGPELDLAALHLSHRPRDVE